MRLAGFIPLYLVIFFLSGAVCAARGAEAPQRTLEYPRQTDAPPVTFENMRPMPVYLSELTNLNDYTLFANGGWDGNWYAGFNVAWLEELPAAPKGKYVRAYIGAKLGRMKTRVVPGKPIWEKEPIPGSVYCSLSSTAAWKSTQDCFLADTKDIPLDGDPENALEGVGESRWFWAEVPLDAVNFDGPNFVALWSPTEYFVSTASSPILAGGWGSAKVNSWMNNDVRGFAPLNPATALKTPISTFEPAIAMKLVPEGTAQHIRVTIDRILDGRPKTANKTFIVSVAGEEIEKAWLEISTESGKWSKHGGYVYATPYAFTLRSNDLPNGKVKIRCVAQDAWGNIGLSDYVEIEISR